MRVYRLENYKGKGPFSASQGMVNYLKPHKDPESMLDSACLTPEEFDFVTNNGLVFGWKSKELMLNFFKNKESSIKRACEMKMKISEYESSTYFIFEDGQILSTCYKKDLLNKWSLKDFFNLMLFEQSIVN